MTIEKTTFDDTQFLQERCKVVCDYFALHLTTRESLIDHIWSYGPVGVLAMPHYTKIGHPRSSF